MRLLPVPRPALAETYGSLDDLIAVTSQFAPKDAQQIKKSRTIQAYVSHFSKSDFESVDEYSEFRQYIEALLNERYSQLFDRFYEGLGQSAANYAGLMGYTPEYVRDPKTLMPHSTLPLKTQWIIREIDAYARTLRS